MGNSKMQPMKRMNEMRTKIQGSIPIASIGTDGTQRKVGSIKHRQTLEVTGEPMLVVETMVTPATMEPTEAAQRSHMPKVRRDAQGL
jgi:hypothetical protein